MDPQRHLAVLICLDDRSEIRILPCVEIVERVFRVEAVFEILKTLRDESQVTRCGLGTAETEGACLIERSL